MIELTWSIKHFSDLSAIEFHDMIRLREAVFIVEQDCVYQDVDGRDLDAYHIVGRNEKNRICCTARILKQGIAYPEVSVGRVCLLKEIRGHGIGQLMMKKSIDFISQKMETERIRISAQVYLEKFYNDIGFWSTGKTYLEDGIPHVEMLRHFD